MKLLLPCLLLSGSLFAQTFNTEILDANNIAVSLNDSSIHCYNIELSEPGFEFPKGSGNQLIYRSLFWFAGVDASGQLAASFHRLSDMDSDQYKGPFGADIPTDEYNNPINYPKSIWKVSKATIDYHKLNFTATGYIVPSELEEWPAHGNVSDGESYNLAPFVDANGNGLYDPENGDYPDIRGDEAVYIISNDNAKVENGESDWNCGIEVHYMYYQFNTDDYLNDAVFLNVRVYNRGTKSFPEFYCSNFLDIDLGDATNDQIGCDSALNMMFGYNGEGIDNGQGTAPGFGTNPPAFASVLLNKKLHAGVFWTHSTSPEGYPATQVQMFNRMQGVLNNATPIIAGGPGGGYETKFYFNCHPDSTNCWNETTAGFAPSDRRYLITAEPESFAPGNVICYDFVYLVNDAGGDNLENMRGLYPLAEEVKTWYDDQWRFNCDQVTMLSTPEKELKEISVFPNPSNSGFAVSTQESGDFRIMNMSGQMALEGYYETGNIIGSDLPSGVYLLEMNLPSGLYQTRLVVE